MIEQHASGMIDITGDRDLWSRCFMVHSLVVIGSKEEDGNYNMAPKHMAMPLGFSSHFGFLGTPRKTTYHNIRREEAFTVSYPRPEQLVISSLTASPREEDDSKPVIEAVPTEEARHIEGRFLKGAYIQLECRLSQIVGKFGEWEMIVGDVVAAYVHKDALRTNGEDMDDDRLIRKAPLLAYLHPNRFSIVKDSYVFPFPKDFRR